MRKNLECEEFCLSLQSQNKIRAVLTEDGVIAQLVEQRTENPCVPGSIPGDTTLKIKQLDENLAAFFVYVRPRFKAVLRLKVKPGVKHSIMPVQMSV